jgi:tRNA(fMet)-specific endonuclease VapC
MILLDTDHLTVLRYGEHSQHTRLRGRLTDTLNQSFATTIVTAEEQLRGWLAEINRYRDVRRQITAYHRLAQMVRFLLDWVIVELDERAAAIFDDLRCQRVRIGTQDLKIAAIALAQDALLLSANFRDFQQVPGLHVENWLE